ncbi:VP1/ABI3-like 3 [Artemisia annua]|uniref:VP1/ABI3-like 3 n=1 Tax=Artemisia annua TaxID=35608 RepID=A0A2U1NLQ5_ARTAN|nr:VP1/ABI3-like 3 [Artemisia annua]
MASSSGMKASSSRSIKTCSNEFCGKSIDVSRPGWKSGGRKVDLCNQCFVAFKRNQFCYVYHKTLKGWKACRSCQQDFHCGCFASSTLYDEINSEIECRGCVAQHANLTQKSDSEETNDDATITRTPRADGRTTIIPTPNDDTTITSTPCVNDTTISPTPHANDTITPTPRANGDAIAQTPRAIYDTTITPTPRAFDDTTITQTPRVIDETTIIPTPRANDDTTITPTPCVNDDIIITPTARANHDTTTITPTPRANHDTTTITATPHALEHNASETSSKTRASAQTSEEKRQTERRHEKSVPYRFVPRMTNLQVEEIKRGLFESLLDVVKYQMGGLGNRLNGCVGENSRIVMALGEEEIQDGPQGPEVKLIPLFEKVLAAADTGKSRWLVLPKNCAEKFFPSIDDQVSKQIVCQDTEGEDWRFKFRSLPKNKGRMYVLDEFYLYVQAMELSLGDTVTFSRLDPERKLVIGYRKNSSESPSNHFSSAAIASTSRVRNKRGIVKLNNVNGEKGKNKQAMPSMVSQGELNAFPRVESEAPRVAVFARKKSVEVGSTSNSSRKKHKLSEVDTPNEAQEPVSSDHGGNGPFVAVANMVKIKSKKDPKPKLVIGHQNATSASSFSQVAKGIVKSNNSAAKAKNKLAKVSKVTKGKPDASASCQSDIPAIIVPFSAKRKHFEVGSTSQGKKQKRKLSEVDVTSDKVQEPEPSPSCSNGTIELVANGVKIKSNKKLERMIREILNKQGQLITGNQNATPPSSVSQDKAETSTRKKNSKGKNSLPTFANICKGKAYDSTSAPPNRVSVEPPVRAKGKHIEIGSTSRSADRKRKISAFDPTLKESTELEWSPRGPRSSKGKAVVRSSTPPPKKAPSKDKSVAKKIKNTTLRTIASSKKTKTSNLEPEPQATAEPRVAPEPSNVTKKHPRHRTGCQCIICIQPPSGSKHSPTCPCPPCVAKRLRIKNMKENTSQKPPIRRRKKVQKKTKILSGSEENQNEGRELSQSAEPSNQQTIKVSSGLEENQNERIEPPETAEPSNVQTITVNCDSEENQNEQRLTGSHLNNTIRPLFDLNLPASDDDDDFVDPTRQYTNAYGGYISE